MTFQKMMQIDKETKSMKKPLKSQLTLPYINSTLHFLHMNNTKFSNLPLPIPGSSSSRLTSQKHPLLFPTSGMLLTLGKKNTVTLMEFGSGERVGEARQWRSKEQEELEERLMVTAIDCIHRRYTQTKWRSILILKF